MHLVQNGGGQLPWLTARAQQFLQLLQRRFVVEFVWIPSHGKRLPCHPHDLFTEAQLREWNARADAAARGALAARLLRDPRAAWFRQHARDRQWELSALTLLSRAGQQYAEFAAELRDIFDSAALGQLGADLRHPVVLLSV